jgi:SAM-dependent methyltransferase
MPGLFYDQLADWWPLFSPPSHYDEEADDLLDRIGAVTRAGPGTLLELGSGGGSLASHLKGYFKLTLTDCSAGMLAVNQAVNPEAEHIIGDMRTLRLNRSFDVVLVHDAIMYATNEADVRATIETAAAHVDPRGTVVFLPDFVKETFTPGTEHGGEDGTDGRAFRYLSWTWDPDPADDTYLVDYGFLLREANGDVRAFHDRHVEGLFARSRWLSWFEAAGIPARSELDRWGRDVFVAHPGRAGVDRC